MLGRGMPVTGRAGGCAGVSDFFLLHFFSPSIQGLWGQQGAMQGAGLGRWEPPWLSHAGAAWFWHTPWALPALGARRGAELEGGTLQRFEGLAFGWMLFGGAS